MATSAHSFEVRGADGSEAHIPYAAVPEAELAAAWAQVEDSEPCYWMSAEQRQAVVELMLAHARSAISQSVAFRNGMRAAANICGSLAETAYDDSDGFAAATGCEAAIMRAVSAPEQVQSA